MPVSVEDYRNVAPERIADAQHLRATERYPFAMYAAGVAVVKLACIDPLNAALDIVTVGEERWRNR
jgi:hypothetical protein